MRRGGEIFASISHQRFPSCTFDGRLLQSPISIGGRLKRILLSICFNHYLDGRGTSRLPMRRTQTAGPSSDNGSIISC
eukprot:7864878-Pyramimonas_sp.AAC.1